MPAILATLAIAAVLEGQVTGTPSSRTLEARKAIRLVRFLELPDRRSQAVVDLLRMGEGSVSALVLGLDHPREDIVFTCLHMLRTLGPAAKDALTRLEELEKGKNKKLAYAAAWCRSRLEVEAAGVTLIADYGGGAIREYDAAGKQTFFRGGMKGLWDVERLANGNYLATFYTGHRVVELTPKGKEVWSFKSLKSPLDADRLASGNTLIADTHGKRVIEVNRAGKIVWKYELAIQPYDADRLANGNTLIADFSGNRVIEVDPKGKTVWSVKASGAFGADRLPNGNTLFSSYTGRCVTEVDAKGKVVMELKGLNSPNEARRLLNGNTLVAAQGMVIEFDSKGKEVSRIKTGRSGTAHRY